MKRALPWVGVLCLVPATLVPATAFGAGDRDPSRADCPGPSRHVVYTNGFDGRAGPEWSRRKVTTAPSGERFLGRFVNEQIVLRLRNLPPHGAVKVSADLLVIMSWDGNNATDGPDIIAAAVGQRRVAATFSNDAAPHDETYSQSYPEPLSSGAANPGLTGSDAVGALGYPDVSAYGGAGDSTYRIGGQFAHTGRQLTLRIASRNVVDVGVDPIEFDESFGLDNVSVSLVRAGCPR